MKKKVILALILVVIFIFVNNKEKELNVLETKELNNNTLSMMLETSAGTGEYQETTASSWPAEGYTFNENLSKCENGSSLNWDNIKKIVVMSGNLSDKCYVYFDKEPDTLVNYIKSQYTGTQGENNLYLHDSTLENGAKDNSYRFAGPSETTNNFVCFGYDSKDGSCPTDYLYRIIGVFDGEVKLIKYDYANINILGTSGDYASSLTPNASYYKGSLTSIDTYYWNYEGCPESNGGNGSNIWSTSFLNGYTLNSDYLYRMKTSWSNKIANHTWKVGGGDLAFETVQNAYKNEITSPIDAITYDAKVGLMYVSDYGYAAAPSAWTTIISSYDESSVITVNWMYMGFDEWTISPGSNDNIGVFNVYCSGNVYTPPASYGKSAVRPVFYLKPEIAYSAGSGTISSPYILE